MSTTEESVRRDFRKPIERVACRAFLNASQENITSATPVKVALNAVTYDLGVSFASNKFTVPVSGLYHIIGQVTYLDTGVQVDKRYQVMVYKNAAAINQGNALASVADYITASVSDEVYLNKDDYIELYAYTSGTGDTVDIYGEANGLATFLVVRLISKEGVRQ